MGVKFVFGITRKIIINVTCIVIIYIGYTAKMGNLRSPLFSIPFLKYVSSTEGKVYDALRDSKMKLC